MLKSNFLRAKFYAITPNLCISEICGHGPAYLCTHVADRTIASHDERLYEVCILTFRLQKYTNKIQFMKNSIPHRFYILVSVCRNRNKVIAHRATNLS